MGTRKGEQLTLVETCVVAELHGRRFPTVLAADSALERERVPRP